MTGRATENHVRAAGGVVWRQAAGSKVEVLLVHRPEYDDWTIPKGRADPGESDEQCALREVEEETGLRCELGEHLGDVAYLDAEGRPKLARYWAMRPMSGSFLAGREVDEVQWLPLPAAVGRLTYERDAAVLAALRGPVPGS